MFFTIFCAVLFILKLIKTVNNISINTLRMKYGDVAVNSFRKLEKVTVQQVKQELDVKFLEICFYNHLYPRFLHLKLSIPRLNGSYIYKQFQRKILFNELQYKRRKLPLLKQTVIAQENSFKNTVPYFTFLRCNLYLFNYIKNYKRKIEDAHQKKLINLGFNEITHPNHSDVVFNFSNRQLTELECTTLAVGLNYNLVPPKPKAADYYTSFELLSENLNKCSFYNPTNERTSQFRLSLKSLAFDSFNLIHTQKIPHNLSSSQINSLKLLSQDKSIVILKPDKGNGVVVINKTEYVTKMDQILQTNKFIKVHEDPLKLTYKLENKVNVFLRKLKGQSIIDETTYKDLSPTGSKPGTLYGLPKIHKPNRPLRPILSTIKTHNYSMCKFLVPLLNQWTTNEYTVKDSFNFADEVTNINYSNKYTMASFDIESLYTNIPLIETINIVLHLAFSNNNLFHGFNLNQFKKFLELSLLDSYFFFNNNLYKQCDGLGMGLAIAPTLANVFLCFHESKWLSDCPIDFKPKLYRRYVDDTFLLFSDPSHVDKFLNYLNSKHPNIKFTKDIEQNNKLSFLDVCVNNNNNNLVTSVYRKSTFTGLFTNFASFIPYIYKLNLVKILIYRAFRLSSTYLNLHSELVNIKEFLINNGYKVSVVETTIKHFLDSKFRQQTLCNTPTVPKQPLFVKMQYYGYHSHKIKKKLNHIIHQYFPQVSLRILFYNRYRLANFFKFKDRTPLPLVSSLVYKFTCDHCQSIYVGKTIRHLATRVSEHKGVSYLTQQPLSRPIFSSIRNHLNDIHNTNHLDISNFKCIDFALNHQELLIKESIHIKQLEPQLNNTESAITLKIY